MYAGVDFDGQAISFGRQDMASVIVSDFTDITEFSGVQQVIDSASDKEDGVFAYRGGFDALQLEATYKTNSAKDSDGYGISGVYSLPIGLDLGLTYAAEDLGAGAGSAKWAVFVQLLTVTLYVPSHDSETAGTLQRTAVG